MKKNRLRKWVVYFSTATLFFAAISPNTFNIPATVHPWIFVFTVMWIVAFSSGVGVQ